MPGGGVVVQVPVKQQFAIRTGVNFLQQGSHVATKMPLTDGFNNGGKADAKTKISYLQLPLNLLYTPAGNRLQFFAGGGPYLSYALSGRTTIEGVYFESNAAGGRDEPFKETQDLFKKSRTGEPAFKRTDFGVNALAGVKLSGGLFAGIGYQLGLSNIGPSKESSYENRSLQLTIGYFFR